MPYVYVNDFSDNIQKLSNPVQAEAVLQEVQTIAMQTDPEDADGDPAGQWLALLKRARIAAQRPRAGGDLLELYPSGRASPDRIELSVEDDTVTVAFIGKIRP